MATLMKEDIVAPRAALASMLSVFALATPAYPLMIDVDTVLTGGGRGDLIVAMWPLTQDWNLDAPGRGEFADLAGQTSRVPVNRHGKSARNAARAQPASVSMRWAAAHSALLDNGTLRARRQD